MKINNLILALYDTKPYYAKGRNSKKYKINREEIMKRISSTIKLTCLSLVLLGTGIAQEASYPSWKHELQDLLGLEQTGKADRATFDALVVYLQDIDLMDDQLEKGYDGMGGYLGFQIYLDNNQEWLLDILRNPIEDDEVLDDIEAEEEYIFEEDEESDVEFDFLGEEGDEDLGFDDSDIDISGMGVGLGDVGFSMHSLGFDVGMYGPSMSYWNDEFIKDTYVNQSLNGSQKMTGFAMAPLFQGSTTFKLGSKIRVSLSGGMWSGTAKAENLVVWGTSMDTVHAANFTAEEIAEWGPGSENGGELGLQYYLKPNSNNSLSKDLSVSIMPLTAMVGYEVLSGLYVGVGMGSNRITQKITDNYTNPDTEAKVSESKSYSGAGSRTIVCVGYEMPLGPLLVGLQGQYVLGKYIQEVSDKFEVPKERDVDTGGIQFLVNLGYYFGE